MKFIKYFKYFLVALQGLSSLIFLTSLFSLNIIGLGLFFLLLSVFVVLFVLSVIKLIVKQNTPLFAQVFFGLISVVTIIAALVAFRYTDTANSFIDKITSLSVETKEYNVLVLKDSELDHIGKLNDRAIGFLQTDPSIVDATSELKNVISYTTVTFNSIDDITSALATEKIPAVAIDAARYDTLAEDEIPITKVTKIIYRFTITIEQDQTQTNVDTAEPFIIYISGSDSRTGIKTTARSDVNIIATVNPATHKILLVSIPRDSYVQLHNTTGLKDKLTHAGIYGIDMSKNTIEDLLGIKIDYTIKVSFDTVIQLVDHLDGIDIDSDQAMILKDHNKNTCHYIVGIQHVNGICALRFARERKSYSSGDRHRGENQQQVITRIIDKLATSKSYLLKLPDILDATADSFETSFSRDDITKLIRHQLESGQNWQVESIIIDGISSMQPTYSMGSNIPLYVVLPDQTSLSGAQIKINSYLTPVDNL